LKCPKCGGVTKKVSAGVYCINCNLVIDTAAHPAVASVNAAARDSKPESKALETTVEPVIEIIRAEAKSPSDQGKPPIETVSVTKVNRKLSSYVLLFVICVVPIIGLGYYLFTPSILVPFTLTTSMLTTSTYTNVGVYLASTPCQYCLYNTFVTLTASTTYLQPTIFPYAYTSTGANTLSPYAVSATWSIAVIIAAILGVSTFAYFSQHHERKTEAKTVPTQRDMKGIVLELQGEDTQKTEPVKTAVTSNMKFCRECGAQIPRDSIFCEECGIKLA
jgi:ribosomal protein L40E